MNEQAAEILERLADGGPVYQETDLGRLIVEPWNAISSLLYLVPVIYFLIRLRGHYREFAFLIYFCTPLLAIGGMGSALFHGLRSFPFFLYMDFVPIAILTLGVSIYFWVKVLPQWWYVLIIIAASMALRFIGFSIDRGQLPINLSYLNTGMMIFIPALIYLFHTRFFAVKHLIWAIVFFGLSLMFRVLDHGESVVLVMGTHWLWHLFSAAGALMLGQYLLSNIQQTNRRSRSGRQT